MAIQIESIIEGTATEIELFLARRLRKLRTEISGVLNINPFLMCALQDFHQIKNQDALANFMLNWHLGNGHATGFGKMIDEKLLPNVFGTTRLDSTFRHLAPYNSEPFDDIDHLVHRSDGEYRLSLKASSWTIQYGQAMGLYRNFHALGEQRQQGAGIVVGVFYGHKGLLTDKYRIVRGENVRRQEVLTPLDYVHVKAGAEFWSWLNDDHPETQDAVMQGILTGVKGFSRDNPTMAQIVGGAASLLVRELRAKYQLPEDGSIDWLFLLHSINDDKDLPIGAEAVEEPSGNGDL
jgi:hypothetical protein